MNWEGHPNYRWKKMYKRIQYVVTCSELNAPKSEEESRHAANLWWQNKLNEINKQSNKPLNPWAYGTNLWAYGNTC